MHRLGSLGHQTGTSEPQPGEHGRATCRKWLMSKHSGGEATMWLRTVRVGTHPAQGDNERHSYRVRTSPREEG